jgi:hypothetical protein
MTRRIAATLIGAAAVGAALLMVALAAGRGSGHDRGAAAQVPPPPDAGFDYQIGGDYPLPPGVSIVSRDWFAGEPAPPPVYSICYVNAFQTQANEAAVDRPDERSNWPHGLVLKRLGDDPHWGGEYLIDVSTRKKRRRAADWVEQMIEGCQSKGFDGVEYDNLDSWTRFDGTPLAHRVPFGKPQALAFARILVARAHALGLAVAQKNTADVTVAQAQRAGFDFAIAEECARYHECGRYRRVYGNHVIVIEYRRRDFRRACETVGQELSVVLRDRLVRRPSSPHYIYDAC